MPQAWVGSVQLFIEVVLCFNRRIATGIADTLLLGEEDTPPRSQDAGSRNLLIYIEQKLTDKLFTHIGA